MNSRNAARNLWNGVALWQLALGELNDLGTLASFLATRPPAGPRLVPAIERRRLAGLERLRRAVVEKR